MKKFLEEFKAFISKGNVLDMAVGVIIGGAEVQGKIRLFGTENYLDYGAFISAVINFLIMALVVFLIVKSVNKISETAHKLATKDEEETAAAPTTKICPYCKSEIDIEATRCPHCTSDLEE